MTNNSENKPINSEAQLRNLQLELERKQKELIEKEREIERESQIAIQKIQKEIQQQEKELYKKHREFELKQHHLEQSIKQETKAKQIDLQIRQKQFERELKEKEFRLKEEIRRKEKELEFKRKLQEKQIPRIIEKAKLDVQRKQKELERLQKDLKRKQTELFRKQQDLRKKEHEVEAKLESRKERIPDRPFKQRGKYLQEETENWLVTYSDVITLLLTMFVFLFSMASFDKQKLIEIQNAINVSLLKKNEITVNEKLNKGEKIWGAVKKNMETIFSDFKLQNSVNLTSTEKGLKLELSNSALYDLGSAEIKPDMLPLLHKLVLLFKNFKNQNFIIDIEGHTDNIPISTNKFPSNWELSAARASNIVRYFITNGIDPRKLRASGYADSRPIAPNTDKNGNPIPENQAKNRRVVIYVEKPN